jgi:hypothetical protein
MYLFRYKKRDFTHAIDSRVEYHEYTICKAKNQAVFAKFVFVAIFIHSASSFYIYNTQKDRLLFLQYQQKSSVSPRGIFFEKIRIFGTETYGKGAKNEHERKNIIR